MARKKVISDYLHAIFIYKNGARVGIVHSRTANLKIFHPNLECYHGSTLGSACSLEICLGLEAKHRCYDVGREAFGA